MSLFVKVAGRDVVLSPQTVKNLRASFEELTDFDAALRDACARTKRLHLGDLNAATLVLRNDLAKQRDKEVRARKERQATAARMLLKPPASPKASVSEKSDTPAVKQKESNVMPLQRKEMTLPAPQAVSRPHLVQLFKGLAQGSLQVMVQTTAHSLDQYIPALAKALADAIYADDGEPEELLRAVLPQAFAIGIKVAGFKQESVKEERVLTAGYVLPEASSLIGHSEA